MSRGQRPHPNRSCEGHCPAEFQSPRETGVEHWPPVVARDKTFPLSRFGKGSGLLVIEASHLGSERHALQDSRCLSTSRRVEGTCQ